MSGAGFDARLDLEGLPQPESVATAVKFVYNWIPAILCGIIFVILILFYHIESDMKKMQDAAEPETK